MKNKMKTELQKKIDETKWDIKYYIDQRDKAQRTLELRELALKQLLIEQENIEKMRDVPDYVHPQL